MVWKQKRLSFQPTAADAEITARFEFQNVGRSAVAIQSVVAACPCTTATASQRSYAPGQQGEIVARFALGDRVGPQQMEIIVATDDPSQPADRLTMAVTVPPVVRLEPDPLRWLPGDPLQARRIHLFNAADPTLQVTAVTPSDPRISARIEPGAQPGQWDLVVTPREDASTFSGSVRIETNFPKDHPKALLAHVQVAR